MFISNFDKSNSLLNFKFIYDGIIIIKIGHKIELNIPITSVTSFIYNDNKIGNKLLRIFTEIFFI